MDNIKKLKDIILELNEVDEAEHVKSITSSVTTSWGEEVWDHEKISRDILQNARDGVVSAKMDIDQIKISTDNDLIKVYAPNEYSLEKLYYIGSSKTEQENMIGAHGEGVKKCLSDIGLTIYEYARDFCSCSCTSSIVYAALNEFSKSLSKTGSSPP